MKHLIVEIALETVTENALPPFSHVGMEDVTGKRYQICYVRGIVKELRVLYHHLFPKFYNFGCETELREWILESLKSNRKFCQKNGFADGTAYVECDQKHCWLVQKDGSKQTFYLNPKTGLDFCLNQVRLGRYVKI